MNHNSVDPKEIDKFSQYAEDWWNTEGPLKTLHDINPVRLQWITSIVNLKNASVLDVGCGGGILTEGLAKLGAKMTGLDAEARAIETAKAHAKQQKLNINYVCEPIEAHKPKAQYDAITCLEMLEHVEDPSGIIQHAKSMLKPGGYLFLSTINRTLKAYLTAIVGAEYVLQLIPRGTHSYERLIKPSELSAILRQHDLEVTSLCGLNYQPFTRKAELSDHDVSVNYLLAARAVQP